MSLYSGFKPIAFQLTPERENAILNEVATDLASKLTPDLLSAFPGFQAPGMKRPTATQRLAQYVTATSPEDRPLIAHPEYVDQYQKGLMPPPVSPFWNGLLGLPEVFKVVQKDMNEVMARLVGGDL